MRKKQLHVIVKYFIPVTAGIETNILETYSVLTEKGWDITIHTSTDTPVKKNSLPRQATYRNLKIKRYPFLWFGFSPKLNWQKADIVALHNFDIFPHLHLLLYSLFLKLTGQKQFVLILTPHGGFNPEWRVFTKAQGFVKRIYHYTIGVLLINSVVDSVRTVSKWEKQEMLKKGVKEDLITVITNGIEKEAYMDVDALASQEIKEKVNSFGRYILQIGRVYMIKNYETTIKALAKLPKDVKFVIAGAPDKNPSYKKITYVEDLKKLTADLKLEDRVIFLGTVHGIDKYYVIKHAQMMVHMAMWESYCNVVHEGMSQGRVCIVADNTALPLLIKDGVNGYVIDTFDAEKLAKKISYVLKNKDGKIVKEISERNKAITLQQSWRNVAQQVHILYSTLYERQKKISESVISTFIAKNKVRHPLRLSRR